MYPLEFRSSIWIMALAAAACAVSAVPEPTPVGKRWVASIDGLTDPKQLPRLEFAADGRVSGYTGCNALSGKWRMEGGAVRLGALAVTKRGCLGPAGDAERRVLAAVNDKSRVSLENGRLILQGAGGERIEFAEGPSTP
jgi:heat shock protein HslJ